MKKRLSLNPARYLKGTSLFRKAAKRRREREADALLLSFPKCGRTWLTLLILRTLTGHFQLDDEQATGFLKKFYRLPQLEPRAPMLFIDHDDFPHWKKPNELRQDKHGRFGSGRVMFLVRDPRDAVVSFYFEQSRRVSDERARRIREREVDADPGRRRIAPYRGTIHEFIREEAGSFRTIVEYYNIWARNRDRVAAFQLHRYEDLKADTPGELRRVLSFMGLGDVSDSDIKSAVEFCRFENMRKLEQSEAFGVSKLTAGNKSDAESYKTRKGKVGGFCEYLNDADVAYMNEIMEHDLDPFYGYSPESTSK